jgi:hypothetical protein
MRCKLEDEKSNIGAWELLCQVLKAIASPGNALDVVEWIRPEAKYLRVSKVVQDYSK